MKIHIGKPITVNQEEYKKKSAIERFFSWIESCKKVLPRYDSETSYLGFVTLAAIIDYMKFWDNLILVVK